MTMPRLRKRRSLVLIASLRSRQDVIAEPTEEDETDHLIEEMISEALGED